MIWQSQHNCKRDTQRDKENENDSAQYACVYTHKNRQIKTERHTQRETDKVKIQREDFCMP